MSMSCPKCGSASKCLDSRPSANDSTRRRYACLSKRCATRWSTLETLVIVDKKGKRGVGVRGRSLQTILRERTEATVNKATGDKLRELLGL